MGGCVKDNAERMRKRGYAFWRPTGATLNLRYPSLSSFPVPHRGGGGLTRNAAYSRPPLKANRPCFGPHENGPKLSRNKPRRERSDHLQATDRQSACQQGRWRAGCPSPTASASERAAKPVAVATDPESPRRRSRDARNCIQDWRHNQDVIRSPVLREAKPIEIEAGCGGADTLRFR